MGELLNSGVRLLRNLGMAASVIALAGGSTGANAGQVTIRLLSGTPTPSPAALASAKPIAMPQMTSAQLKARGLLNEDGSIAVPPATGKPMSTAPQASSPKILSTGNPGAGDLSPIEVFPEKYLKAAAAASSPETGVAGKSSVAPMNFGFSEMPFTTSRVELTGKQVNSKMYPYRAAGKLYILNPDGSIAGHCSASLIAKGILVTAAHCVTDYNSGQYYAGFLYYPGFFNGKALGKVYARAVVAPDSYLYGGGCLPDGVTCLDDVALIVLSDQRGKYIGTKTGWLGFGYDLWSFNSAYETHVTQLGYPGGLDYGSQMIRNDAQGISADGSVAYNTLIGSQMNGGSSGGPWIANFGMAAYPNGVGVGEAPYTNIVVGVTSWGYPNAPVFSMGASPFIQSNILDLYTTACGAFPLACAP